MTTQLCIDKNDEENVIFTFGEKILNVQVAQSGDMVDDVSLAEINLNLDEVKRLKEFLNLNYPEL